MLFVFLLPRLRRGKGDTAQAAKKARPAPKSGSDKTSSSGRGSKLSGLSRFLSRRQKNPSRGRTAETSLRPKKSSSSQQSETEPDAEAYEEDEAPEEDPGSSAPEGTDLAGGTPEVKSESSTEETARSEATQSPQPSEQLSHEPDQVAPESPPPKESGTVVIRRSASTALASKARKDAPLDETLLEDEPHPPQLPPAVKALLAERLAEWSSDGPDEGTPPRESEGTEPAAEDESALAVADSAVSR